MHIFAQGRQQQRNPPTLLKSIKKFFSQFKIFIYKFEIIQGYELINISQFLDQVQNTPQILAKIITIWKCQSNQQIWWEYSYDQSIKILSIEAYVTINSIIMKASGVYNINLITQLFERYNRELDKQKIFFQFIINPLTGSMKISSKSLSRVELLRSQLIKPQYMIQLLQLMRVMVIQCQHFMELNHYFNGNLKICPAKSFLRTKKLSKKNFLTPEVFLKSINTSINQIDPNCPDQIQSFGSLSSISEFVSKNQISMPNQVLRIIQILKGYTEEDSKLKIEICRILDEIYHESYKSSSQYYQCQKLAKKIKILGQPQLIQWREFAKGGFGKLQKAQVRYQLTQLTGEKLSAVLRRISPKV